MRKLKVWGILVKAHRSTVPLAGRRLTWQLPQRPARGTVERAPGRDFPARLTLIATGVMLGLVMNLATHSPEPWPERVSEEDYLEAEKRSEQRHEYRDGVVVAMAGASKRHERISGKLFMKLGNHLNGKPCEVFKSDMRLNMNIYGRTFYLYPDLMVACDPEDRESHWVRAPKLLIEVLSEDENRDRIEKFLMYQRIPSLEEYAVVSQRAEFPEVSVFRKSEGWEPGHVHTSGDVTFHSIGLTVRVEELYLA